MDDLLDLRVEVLDAQAETPEAQLLQRFEMLFRRNARIGFDRKLVVLRERRPGEDAFHQPAKLVGSQESGRTAAEMDLRELRRAAEAVEVEIPFLDDGLDVGRADRTVAGDAGVA